MSKLNNNCWEANDLLDRISFLNRLDMKKDLRQKNHVKYSDNLNILDIRLKDLGLNQRPIGGDGNCFYLALADQLKRHNIIVSNYNFSEENVLGISGQYPLAAKRSRFDLVLHMARHSNDYRLGYSRKQFAGYLQRMRNEGNWAGGQEIAAAADFYNVCIDCFSVSSDGLNIETYFPRRVDNESEEVWEKRCSNLKTLRLCLHGNHFWSTRTYQETEKESEIESDIDSDEDDEIVCQLFKYKGTEYLLGTSPESEKNKVYQRHVPNDYIGRLIVDKDGEDQIDFSIEED